ncbi:uncharacterized protein LJ206_012428 [Theristicus caerulescens]
MRGAERAGAGQWAALLGGTRGEAGASCRQLPWRALPVPSSPACCASRQRPLPPSPAAVPPPRQREPSARSLREGRRRRLPAPRRREAGDPYFRQPCPYGGRCTFGGIRHRYISEVGPCVRFPQTFTEQRGNLPPWRGGGGVSRRSPSGSAPRGTSGLSLRKPRVAQVSGFGFAFGWIPLLHGNGPKFAGERTVESTGFILDPQTCRPRNNNSWLPAGPGPCDGRLFASQYSSSARSFLRGCTRRVQTVKLTLYCASHAV